MSGEVNLDESVFPRQQFGNLINISCLESELLEGKAYSATAISVALLLWGYLSIVSRHMQDKGSSNRLTANPREYPTARGSGSKQSSFRSIYNSPLRWLWHWMIAPLNTCHIGIVKGKISLYIFFFHMLNGFELHQFSSDLEIIRVDILKHLWTTLGSNFTTLYLRLELFSLLP